MRAHHLDCMNGVKCPGDVCVPQFSSFAEHKIGVFRLVHSLARIYTKSKTKTNKLYNDFGTKPGNPFENTSSNILATCQRIQQGTEITFGNINKSMDFLPFTV